ncbi:MAG TPA: hypothetical protein VFP32_02985 [Candidatus Saccharimonadales bacterium]|nr:hypothetical protein [Candidatus Saccharimonadales bacterium]
MKLGIKDNQNGQILVTLLIVMPFLMLMISGYLTLSSSNLGLARQDELHTQAQLAADAGIDYAVEQINQDPSWVGTGGEKTPPLHDDGVVKTTYEETVTSNGSISKTIVSIGRAYWPSTSNTLRQTVKISVDLRPVTTGNYSVVSGEGGLFMNNSAKIAGGDVLINGQISLTNSAQIGLSTNPVNVDVADQVCPVPTDPNFNSQYPRICNDGEQDNPISISNNAHIYGTVKANNQKDAYTTSMTNLGLTASSGVTAQPLPTYDRDAQKAAVTPANTISGGYSCSGGNPTWQANTEIIGDVSISNKCKVTVLGNIWITGKMTIANSAQLVVDDGLGATRPVIMVDGSDGISMSQGSQLTPNSTGTGFEIITYWSAASCSPDCPSVTGADLYNSRNHTTISLSNSSGGANSVFYSRWTEVSVNNSGQIGALIGETVQMSNTATVTFTTSTGGVGTTFWVVNGYRRIF